MEMKLSLEPEQEYSTDGPGGHLRPVLHFSAAHDVTKTETNEKNDIHHGPQS